MVVDERSSAANLLGLRVRISRECCVLSGRGLCDRPITRPEESYHVCVCVCVCVCVSECYLETSTTSRPMTTRVVFLLKRWIFLIVIKLIINTGLISGEIIL